MIIDLKTITGACKRYRNDLGVTQLEVAYETHYSVENISAFENGRNDSLMIFLWYLQNGFTMRDVELYVEERKNFMDGFKNGDTHAKPFDSKG